MNHPDLPATDAEIPVQQEEQCGDYGQDDLHSEKDPVPILQSQDEQRIQLVAPSIRKEPQREEGVEQRQAKQEHGVLPGVLRRTVDVEIHMRIAVSARPAALSSEQVFRNERCWFTPPVSSFGALIGPIHFRRNRSKRLR